MMTLLDARPASAVTLTAPAAYSLRSYQQEAVDATVAAFKLDSKATVLSACGTGKTVTMLALLQELDAFNVGFFCPNLSLLQQVVQKWREFTDNGIDVLIVCSDQKVGKATPDDITLKDLRRELPDVEVTQDPARITEFLNEGSPAFTRRPRIVFGTYQSSHKVATAQESTDVQFDLIIADEAHYLGTRDRKRTARQSRNGEAVRNPEMIRSRRRVFTTATQRVVSSRNGGNTDTHASMDDTDLFGEVAYELGLRDAINLPVQSNGLQVLTDYQILVLHVSEQQVDAVYPGHEFAVDIHNAETRDAIAAIAATQLRDNYGVTRMISYHAGVERAERFAESLRRDGFDYAETITGDVPMQDRKEILEQLGRGGVVTNVNCLTEGIDVPALEAVLLVDPRSSEIDIVQIVGRALRPFRYEDGPRAGQRKELGYVVLPILVHADGSTDEAVFDNVCDVLRKMAANDERLRQELITGGMNARRNAADREADGHAGFDTIANRDDTAGYTAAATGDSSILVIASTEDDGWDPMVAEQISARTSDLTERLALKAFDASVDIFEARLEEYVAWCAANGGRRPSQSSTDPTEKRLAAWMRAQRTSDRTGRLSAARCARLESRIPSWNIGVWEESLAVTVNWSAANPGRRPRRGSTDPVEVRVYLWIMTQRAWSNDGRLFPARAAILDSEIPWWNDASKFGRRTKHR